MKKVKTWILIADAARARVVANEGPGKGVQALEGMVFADDAPATRHIMSDRPGRSFESVGSKRHAMEYASDPRAVRKAQFIGQLAGGLLARVGEFDRLVLVAPPAAMGLLRDALDDRVANKVADEVVKDFTQVSNADLPERLKDVIVL